MRETGRGRGDGPEGGPTATLSAGQAAAARELIRRVRREVDAELVQASLFGSRARGDARPDSDVDVLLVFRRLPEDREPQATHAEALADAVAEESGVPVTAWSVSLVDLECGWRTPMLVDALADAIPLWVAERPLPPISFTAADALWCTGRLLGRVEEGGFEVGDHLSRGASEEAAKRGRDDVVRLCTALLLLQGRTRPRRAAAVTRALPLLGRVHAAQRRVLRWAAASFGPDGRDDGLPVAPPPGGLRGLRETILMLRKVVAAEVDRLADRFVR